mmetsp:Transcript_79342/g.250653  ORF Transcript_79342/g.250653 Transcript_79342/m.250653 type:complete len:266 (-) Transcript_79342:541-1338(-)
MRSSCLPYWNISTVAPVSSSSLRFSSNLNQSAWMLGSSGFGCSQEMCPSARRRPPTQECLHESMAAFGRAPLRSLGLLRVGQDMLHPCEVEAVAFVEKLLPLLTLGRSCLISSTIFAIASFTKPVMTTWRLSIDTSLRTCQTWVSARRATFHNRTFLASEACVMPRNLQSEGEVVAFTTSVSAAIPLTRKRIWLPSLMLSCPLARSCRTRIPSARPTMPRRPPHVMTQMSAKLTLSPTRLRKGRRIRSITKRSMIMMMYIRTVQR